MIKAIAIAMLLTGCAGSTVGVELWDGEKRVRVDYTLPKDYTK